MWHRYIQTWELMLRQLWGPWPIYSLHGGDTWGLHDSKVTVGTQASVQSWSSRGLYRLCKDKRGKKSICLCRDGEQSPRVEEMELEPRETKVGRIQRGQKKTNTPNWSKYSQAFGDNWKHLKSDLAKLRMKMDTHTHTHPATPQPQKGKTNKQWEIKCQEGN